MRAIAQRQFLEIGPIANRIDGRGIDNQQRRGFVVVEKARVGLIQPLQVRPLDPLFR